MRQSRPVHRLFLILLSIVVLSPLGTEVTRTQQRRKPFVPVTDAMLQNPAPGDWLMWRRTLNSWGYSPLDQINRDNVGDLRMIWTRALRPGSQQGTPLAYGGVLYMPNPKDIIQAIDVASGDLIWEHQRDLPNDVWSNVGGYLAENNRNIAIHGNYIIDTSVDDHVFALDATTGKEAWATMVLDYKTHPALQGSGPIVANGKVITGRSCFERGGPEACVITAHDAKTGKELWRRRTIPKPGEKGNETWGDVPYEDRKHVGAWMVPSYDPELNLIYIGTSVTSPAPKFMLGGKDLEHLYHNCTLALNADTGVGLQRHSRAKPAMAKAWSVVMRRVMDPPDDTIVPPMGNALPVKDPSWGLAVFGPS